MTNKRVLHVLNSGFGIKGNIGYRTYQLIRYSNDDVSYKIIARSGIKYEGLVRLNLLGLLSRFLNLLRKRLLPKLNNRIVEIWIWEIIGYLSVKWYSPTIVHSWEYLPKLTLYCKKVGIRYVQEVPILPMAYNNEMNLHSRLFYSASLDKMEQNAMRLADMVISPSKYLSNYIKKSTEKVTTVPFGTDLQSNMRNRSSVDNSKHTYIFVGNINLRKGFDLLHSAWMNENFEGDRLIVLGRRDKSIPIEYLHTRGIEYHGFCDPNPFYEQSDTFVFPSFSEGSAKVIYEAASHGLLCIVSAQSGSVLENMHDGLVLNDITLDNLVNSMVIAKNNAVVRKRLTANASESIRNYTWERYSKSVQEVYGRV